MIVECVSPPGRWTQDERRHETVKTGAGFLVRKIAITMGIPLITADQGIIRWNDEKRRLQVIQL